MALLWLGAGWASATITNGDFSSGLTGWSTRGATSTATSYTYGDPQGGTISPTAGTQVAEIVTTGVNRNSLANFMGTSVAALNALVPENARNGSGIKTSFTSSGSVTFDWYLWTRDYPPYNDHAFVALSGPGITGTQLVLLSDINSFAGPPNTNGPANGTGWQTSTLNLPGTGTYTIGFGALNAIDRDVNTYLYIDNVRSSPMPEPSSALAALAAIGLVGWLPFRRRVERRRQMMRRQLCGADSHF